MSDPTSRPVQPASSEGIIPDDELRSMTSYDFMALDTDEISIPSNEEWARMINPQLVSLRIAQVILGKSKSELVEHVASLRGTELFDEMIAGLRDVSDLMQALHDVADVAVARAISAWAVVELRERSAA